jgi:uncharacterized membrane protein
LQVGPERSTQFNYGVRHARGTYLYRIDGDFQLDPNVITACVELIERDSLDAVAVPNRSVGESYWAQVRALERDTYLDDSLIVAARFWKRSAFEAVGGFDESLVSCEDYDLHNRLIAQGYKVGRVTPVETHLGEASSLWTYAAQSLYYGPSALRYLRKHPQRGMRQMFLLRPAYLRHWQTLTRHPDLLFGLVVLKVVQYTAAAAGIVAHGLGFTHPAGRLSPNVIAALVLVLAAVWGLIDALSRFGIQVSTMASMAGWVGGLALWHIVGRYRAHQQHKPLSLILPRVALAFSPVLVTWVMGKPGEGGISREAWPFLFGLALAACAGWLTFLAQPVSEGWVRRVGPPALVSVSVVGFIVVFSLHSLAALRAFALGAYDLALYDQALWTSSPVVWGASAHGLYGGAALSNLLYTSISGHSILADNAAPVLLLFLPAYALGLGGPALLLVSQAIATGLAAVALYRLASDQIGRGSAALIGIAYLVYFVTVRIGAGSLQVAAFGVPLILFALDAYRLHRYTLYYVLIILALTCGVDVGLAVAMLGLYLVWPKRDYLQGLVTLGLGLGWTLIAIGAFVPFFGGTPEQVLMPYQPAEKTAWLEHIARGLVRPETLRYAGSLLASLGFIPLLGAPLLLPALPRLLLNLLANGTRYTSLAGWYEFTITPFLFVAAIRGVEWLGTKAKTRGWTPPHLAGSTFILTSSLVTAAFLSPNVVQDFQSLRITTHHQIGYQIFAQIPESASVAAQSPFGIALAHRRQLTILPQVGEADFILFDVLHPNREPQPETYQETLQRAFYNPAYGLRVATDGYLLFERGLSPDVNLAQLALVTEPKIEHARTVELSATVAYLGFDLSTTRVEPGQVFYVTHYWKSLSPAVKPYLLFTAYPGVRRFEEIALGLFPVTHWQPGNIVRHEQAVTLPTLPDGDGYEMVIGLWYDVGEPSLRSADQLLGNDVIRIATITARHGQYTITPWASNPTGSTR